MTPSTPPAAPSGQNEEPATSSNRRRRILIAGVAFLAALTLCLGLTALALRLTGGPSAPQPTATVQPAAPTTAPTPAATPTATAEPTATAQPVETAQPVGQPPQPQLRHPTQYLETGVGNSKSWTFQLGPDEVLIVGGWAVDGTSGGVYKAWPGGQSVTVSVTDGFALVIAQDWARDEFCFRLSQAVQYGWAHGTVEPLPGWDACG